MDPRAIRDLFGRFAPHYEVILGGLDYRGPALVGQAVAALANPAPVEVLDLGCGTGLGGLALPSRPRFLLGVDLCPAMLDRARARQIYDGLLEAELTAFLRSTAAGSWDLILAVDSLCYLPELRPVFVLAARALRRGGALVVTLERGDDRFWSTAVAGGRVAHNRAHVFEALEGLGLAAEVRPVPHLRRQDGRSVPGWLVSARRAGGGD